MCPILAPSSDSTSWPGLGGGEVPPSSPAPRAWTLGPWFLAQAPMGVDQSWVQSPPTRPSHKHVQTALNMLSPAQGPEEWQRTGRVRGDRLYRLPQFWVLEAGVAPSGSGWGAGFSLVSPCRLEEAWGRGWSPAGWPGRAYG